MNELTLYDVKRITVTSIVDHKDFVVLTYRIETKKGTVEISCFSDNAESLAVHYEVRNAYEY